MALQQSLSLAEAWDFRRLSRFWRAPANVGGSLRYRHNRTSRTSRCGSIARRATCFQNTHSRPFRGLRSGCSTWLYDATNTLVCLGDCVGWMTHACEKMLTQIPAVACLDPDAYMCGMMRQDRIRRSVVGPSPNSPSNISLSSLCRKTRIAI